MNTDDLTRVLTRPPAETRTATQGLPTGSVSLDILLGGGWRKGSVSELYGPPDSGTTTVALRTIAAVQRANPGENVVLYDKSPDSGSRLPRYAATLGADLHRLIIARNTPVLSLKAAITVIDGFSGNLPPPRENLDATLLVITRKPGLVRAAASVHLQRSYGSPWTWAELAQPSIPDLVPQAPVHLATTAWFQEILQAALQYGLAEVHGKRWYYCGQRKIAGGWHDAVQALQDDTKLLHKIINGIAEKTGLDASNWLTHHAIRA